MVINTASKTIDQCLDDICHELGRYLPNVALRGPASQVDIDKLQAQVGVPLPAALTTLYSAHDGEGGGLDAIQLLCGYDFLPIAEACDAHQFWLDAMTDLNSSSVKTNIPSYPADCVQPVVAHRRWIPIAGCFTGNYLAVDMAPAQNGVIGQIINFGLNDPHHFQVAHSLEEFLKFTLARYRCGDLHPNLPNETYLYDEFCSRWRV